MKNLDKIKEELIIEIQELRHKYNTLKESCNEVIVEEELRLRESYLSAIIENQPGLLWMKDLDGKFLAVNTQFSISCGLGNPESLIGKTDFDIWPQELAERYVADDKRVIKSEQSCMVEEPISDKGDVRWFETFKTPIIDKQGNVIGTTGYSRDITERKRMEEELYKSEQHYKMISELTSDYVYKLGVAADGKVTLDFVSDNFYTITGLSKEDAITIDLWSKIAYPDDLTTILEHLRKLIVYPQSIEIECRSNVLGKKLKWVNIIAKSEWDEQENRVTTIVGAVKDITERKQAEVLIKEKTDELELQNEALNQINAELKIAKEKAEESDRLKTSFLQNMSHEIRTPMNAIMGFSDLLVQNYNNKPKLEQFAEIINLRCNDLLEIINDILDISKIESGQLTVNNEECNLDELFAELTVFFRAHQKRIGKQEIKLHLQSFCQLSESIIVTDKVKLKQIFLNLISNAFKFTETGKIEGGCKFDDNHHLTFYVSDTGIGIPPDKHEAIFERFTQLLSEKKQPYGGTGLGLSIVKGLIDLLDGKIWLESELENLPSGKVGGTTFYFSFPYKISQIAHQKSLVIEEKYSYHFPGKTILLVEDDIFNAEYIKEILSDTGTKIIYTKYGNEAIQIATSQSMDLILMDIQLPDITGFEATRKIKLQKPNSKIIAQTAYAAYDDRKKAFDAGCIDYISKPIKRDLLLEMINKHLG
jgi:PAS domain S-box-containing protein